MGDVHECYAQRAMHLLELHLHILTHLEVKGRKRLVEEQHLRAVYDGAGDSHTLLLSTRERLHIAMFVVGHAHHLQGTLHTLFNLALIYLLKLKSEGDIVVHIVIREKGVALKHSIHGAQMWRYARHLLATNEYFTT